MEFQDNSIINNIHESVRSLDIANVKKFKSFMRITKTEQADNIMTQIRGHMVCWDKVVFYFNDIKKLWVQVDENQYTKFIYDFLLNTTKKVRKLMKKEDIDDEERTKINTFLSGCFDADVYINTIIKRSFSLLYNSGFIPLLDSSKEYFPIKNGNKINFKTLEITPRTNKDLFTYESPVDYIDQTPNADKFFNQLFSDSDNREYVRKALGYMITAETMAQVFFIWYGFGSNGKSLLAKILELILCKQYCQCDESVFIKHKKNSGQASPELMALLGKRSGFYSEGDTADNVEMNESGLKRISGEDKITGRYLYGQMLEFYPYVKLNMLTNFIPSLSADKAMKRRIRYIFFDKTFVHNPTKPNELKIDQEFADKVQAEYLSEIFSWIAKGAMEFYRSKTINMSKEYVSRTEKLLSEGDSIECFLKRRVVKTNKYEDTIKKNELFDIYKNFCNENSQRCIARSTLWARVSQNGINTRPLHGYDVYYGVTIDFNKAIEEMIPIPNLKADAEPDYKALYFDLLQKMNNKPQTEEEDLEALEKELESKLK
jgi:P4 family phage/plasmid primase-like protien